MPADYSRACEQANNFLQGNGAAELTRRMEPRFDNPSPKVPTGRCVARQPVECRRRLFADRPEAENNLLDPETARLAECYKRNIENFIGTVKRPGGIAGPLRVNGLFAHGDYYVPLATTEAALVASYNRGAQLISDAGGCASMVLNEGVSRAPGFAFNNLREAGLFVTWLLHRREEFKTAAQATTRYGKLIDMSLTVEGNHVYLRFEFTTGDASGQNMATIATEAICSYILAHSPVRPRYFTLEANLSGDKKATTQSFLSVRGKKVSAEVIVPSRLVESALHATPERMVKQWLLSAMGAVQSGTIGIQGHYANGLAALFIACGQDAACVAECAVGVTRLELTPERDLYAAVTLPNLIVGTVGGGTSLPSQKACLDLMGLAGTGKARSFAEVCAGLCLAGELSIIGALCAGDFARAHRCFARGKRSSERKEGNGTGHEMACDHQPV